MMWGVTIGALLVAAGIALLTHGLLSLDAAQERERALLYSTVLSSLPALASTIISVNASDAHTPREQAFLSSASFAFMMDAPVYTSFYLFNVTNSADVLRGTAAPQVQQLGPYVYEKRSRKVNVTLDATPFNSTKTSALSSVELPASYGHVSYSVVSSYAFAPERSNGSESDVVVTINASYARRLEKLRARGYSERFVLAEAAQQHMRAYAQHLERDVVADAKLRAWTHFLPALVTHVQHEALPAVLTRQQQRVDAASIPASLVRMYAVARTEMIPRVLGDVYKDISDQFLPGILQETLTTAKRQALPRVLSNLQRRLLVETVPFWLDRQQQRQQQRFVPRTLASLNAKIELIAFPYVLSEVYDRACLDAVPSILRTIKTEIVAQSMAINRVTADDAQRNVVEAWRKQGSVLTDVDAWFDDAPTGQARTGFELDPPSASLQLSLEAANLLLGSKVTNKRFSIVDYDAAVAATYPLGEPTVTPEGFGIWKQVIAMNESAIAYVLEGVNTDVALVSDFLTHDQLLFVRAYLVRWATSAITQRDRERLWRQGFTKRTVQSDQTEPSIDVDVEKPGIQTGFKLQPTGASTSGVTAALAQELWNTSSEFAFVNLQGFTKWQAVVRGAAGSTQALTDGIAGLTAAHVAEVSAWIQALLTEGVVRRRALRHWSDGTCVSALGLPLAPCLRYDLEPGVAGNQTGFEMNPLASTEWRVPQTVREALWSRANKASFLIAAHSSSTALGFGMWLRAIRTSDVARLVTDAAVPLLTASSAQGVVQWLANWSSNVLNVLHVHNWWRASTCLERETLSVTGKTTTSTPSLATCTPAYSEVETASVLKTEALSSPFLTWEKTFAVTETLCDVDAVAKTFTKHASTYTLNARVFSCDAVSTSLADDQDDATTGFELMPGVSVASDRLSLAAASVLWDPQNANSFVHVDGYRRWFAATTPSSSDAVALLQSISAAVDAACSSIVGGGVRSGVFNETLSLSERCGRLTTAQFAKVQAYVVAQSTSKWVSDALLDQWRRGAANELELEPYRSGKQRGYELAAGCVTSACVLTQDSGTVYQVPRAALRLWDVSERASFVHDSGWTLWSSLLRAAAQNDATAVAAAKSNIVTACAVASWEDWMQRVVEWLDVWLASEHLLRDVLGHWMHAQCPTTPRLVNVVQRAPDVVSTVSACPPAASRYTIALKDSIVDLQTLASRPTTFFRADVVETSALVQPTKVVDVDETWITCEQQSPNVVKQTVSSQTSRKEYQACNFLSVLADAYTVAVAANAGSSTFLPLPVAPAEVSFEMNRTVVSSISIDVALQLWNASTAFAFTNVSVFLSMWHPAVNDASALAQIQHNVEAITAAQSPSDLTPVQQYLTVWESSSIATRRVGMAWLAQSNSVLDLDASTDGVQGGFELYPSGEWKRIAGDKLPTFDQAQYLWRAESTYSFLNTNGKVSSNGLPTGFAAWKEIYDGVDFSSEQLTPKYPAEATVQRSDTMAYTLSPDQRKALALAMAAETTLTDVQLRGVAAWLLNWANNAFLRTYILQQWATGTTPRGELHSAINFADHVGRLFGLNNIGTLPPDLLTVPSPLVASVSPTSRKQLWDVLKPGSLLNPTTHIVWCTILNVADATSGASTYCPSILNDYGATSATALAAYKAIVQASVSTEITKSSNFTRLSIAYVQRQFEIESEHAVVAIAMWWRQLPTTSVFFQANQLRTWRASGSAATVSSDPLRFGFDLGFVFPVNASVARNATVLDLVANTVVVAGNTAALSTCAELLELYFVLWYPSNAMSFLHPLGARVWHKYIQYALDTTEFVRLIETSSDSMTIKALHAASSNDVTCALEATRNWLASWQQHPHLRQFVEFLWFQSLHAPSSSSLASPLLTGASDLLRAFPLDTTTTSKAVTTPLSESDVSLQLWANVSRTVLDASQASSLVNWNNGSALWQSLLVNCSASDAASGACRNTSERSQATLEHDVASAKVALAVLSQALKADMTAFTGTNSTTASPSVATLEAMITARVVPWMLSWLDHRLFRAFVLRHARDVDPSVVAQAMSLSDLALAQFVNSTATRMTFAVPSVLDSDLSAPCSGTKADDGVASERFPLQRLVFDAVERVPRVRSSFILPGFGELKAFCDLHDQDQVFAYDVTTVCKLNVEYAVSLDVARALMALFADDTPWEWPRSTAVNGTVASSLPPSTRAALLIDAFLAQPFDTRDECTFVMQNIAAAYSLTKAETQQACATATSSGSIYLDLPMLAAAGFGSKPRSYTSDVQAYLRYAATRFVYEPNVLGLQPTAFVSRSPPPPNGDVLEYPLGGYLAVSNVSRVLFARTDAALSGMWRNDSVEMSQQQQAPSVGLSQTQRLTVQVPLRDDVALFQKKNRVVGEILAIDNSTNVSICGERVALSALRVTDGSQFTTVVLTSKTTNGANDFPPDKVLFYWDYARRFVEAQFERNITRFGVPLMRYTVTNWLSPTSFPSGLSDTARSSAAVDMINMSLLQDDLPLTLSAATSLAEDSSDTSIDVDPLTGSVYHRRLVWQLNTHVTRDASRDEWHTHVREGWLPVVWVHEQASVSSTSGLSLATTAKPGPFAKEKVAAWEVAGGVVYIVVGAVVSIVFVRRRRLLHLRHLQSVLPEQNVLLLQDEQSTLATAPSSSKKPARRHHDSNSGKVEQESHSASIGSTSRVDDTSHEQQLLHASNESQESRGRKRKQPRIETIVEQTDGISDDVASHHVGQV